MLDGVMIELILLMLLFVPVMARKPKRRFTLRAVRSTNSINLLTLNSLVALAGAVYGNADGAYRIMSFSGTWSLRNHTVGEGPLQVGYAHGSYSATQIKEFIESGASISIGNKLADEQAGRLIRLVGTFSGDNAEETLNDGKPIKTRLNWAIPIGTNFNKFIYNDSGANLTTGSVVDLTGTGWVKDY